MRWMLRSDSRRLRGFAPSASHASRMTTSCADTLSFFQLDADERVLCQARARRRFEQAIAVASHQSFGSLAAFNKAEKTEEDQALEAQRAALSNNVAACCVKMEQWSAPTSTPALLRRLTLEALGGWV